MKYKRKIVISRNNGSYTGYAIVSDSQGKIWRLESSGETLELIESDLNTKFKSDEKNWFEFGKMI
jgi:hypothetical protein